MLEGSWIERARQLRHRDRLSATTTSPIELPNTIVRLDPDGIVESLRAHRSAKRRLVSIERVRQDDSTWNVISDSATNHLARLLHLGLENYLFGNLRFLAPLSALGPALWQIQLEIDRKLLGPCRHGQADADLPGLDWLPRAQCLDGISRGTTAHLAITPGRVGDEVLQLLMDSAHLLVIGTAACSDRLDALSLPLAQQPQGVGREGRSPAVMPEDLADAAEVLP